jgi:7-cyano-7-deazaguanine synthase
MKKINNVLWTGGWDSTFRVIQLYRLGATIQPIYIIDHNRKSLNKEIEVINSLAKRIPSEFKQSNGHILPIKFIKRKDIPANLLLKIIHKILRQKVGLGKQYYWLASFAKKYKNLEVSFHKEDLDKFFSEEQLIEVKNERLGSNWIINPKKLDLLRKQLLKNMSFPLITITKPEMKQVAEENNFIELLESTWFCHKSTVKPCGKCAPCKQYIRDGFGYRLK